MKTRSSHRLCVKTGARVVLTKVHATRGVLKRAQRMGWILPSYGNTNNNNNNNQEAVLGSRSLNDKHKREHRSKLKETTSQLKENLLAQSREDTSELLQLGSRPKMQCKVRKVSEEKPVASRTDKPSMINYNESENEAHFDRMESGNATQIAVQTFKEATRVPYDDIRRAELEDNSEEVTEGANMEDNYSMLLCNEHTFYSEDETNELEYGNATQIAVQTFKEATRVPYDVNRRAELEDNSEEVIEEANMEDDYSMLLCNEHTFYSEDETDELEYETFQTEYVPAREERSSPTDTEEIIGPEEKSLCDVQTSCNEQDEEITGPEEKSLCDVQISCNEQDQQKQPNLSRNKKESIGNMDDGDKEEEILSWSDSEGKKQDNGKFQLRLKDALVRNVFKSVETEKEQSKIYGLKKKLALLEEQNRELQEVTTKLQSRMNELEKEVDKKTTHDTQVDLDVVLKKSSVSDTNPPVSLITELSTNNAARSPAFSCKSSSVYNRKALLNPSHCSDVVPLGDPISNAIPPNSLHTIQYPQFLPQTQLSDKHYKYPHEVAVQTLQRRVQVPMLPGYAFPSEESRVQALRSYMYADWLAQQQWQFPPPQYPRYDYCFENTPSSDVRLNTLEKAPVRCPSRANAEILTNATIMNTFVPNDDFKEPHQNRHSYLWMRRKFPQLSHSLLEQRQQQQPSPQQYLQQQQHPSMQQQPQPQQYLQQQQHPSMQQQPQPQQYLQQQQHPSIQPQQQSRQQEQQQSQPYLQQQLPPKQQQKLRKHPQQHLQQQHPSLQQQQLQAQPYLQQQQHPSMEQQQPTQQEQQQDPNIPIQKHQQQEPQGHLQLFQNLTEAIQIRPELQQDQHQGSVAYVQIPESDAFTFSPNNIVTTISSVIAKNTADAVLSGFDRSNHIQHSQSNLTVPCAAVESETAGKSVRQCSSKNRSTNVTLLAPSSTPSYFSFSGVCHRDNGADYNSMKTTFASTTKDGATSMKKNDMDSEKIDSIHNKIALKPQWKTAPDLNVPPQPSVAVVLTQGNVVLSWSMTKVPLTPIAKYEIYSYLLEERGRNAGDPWRHVGTLTAEPLPMACSLTDFEPGFTYYFAVRAVDIYGCKGKLSPPCKVTITID